jgi:hypothetical protein
MREVNSSLVVLLRRYPGHYAFRKPATQGHAGLWDSLFSTLAEDF